MLAIKNRFLSSLELLKGPFQVYGKPRLQILTRSERDGFSQRELNLPEMESGFDAGNTEEFPLHVRYSDDRLFLSLPAQTSVQRSSLTGWETIWNGFQAKLSETQLSIPAYGRWRICSNTASTEIFIRHPLEMPQGSRKVSFASVLAGLKSSFSKYFSGAVLAHGAIALLIFMIQNGSFKFITEMKLSQPEQEQAMEAAAPEMAVQVAVQDDEDAFNGRSIFAVPPRPVDESIQKEPVKKDLGSKLKNLAQLLKAPSQRIAFPSAANRPSNGNTTGAFAQSLSSLKSTLGKPMAGQPQVQVPHGKPQVSWTPQFMAGTGGSGTVNDTRQLMEAFAKHQDRFRDCYESALLKFDELSVTVNFEGVVNGSGAIGGTKFIVNGRATPDSKEALTGCLNRIMSQIQVDKKYSGTRVKNQFIFKS